MSDSRYRGDLPHFTSVAASAGFTGIEPEPVMLGPYRDVAKAHEVFTNAGLELSSLAFVAPWRSDAETAEERAEADYFIQFLAAFPCALMMLVHLPGSDRSDKQARQQAAFSCMDAVAKRALDAGLTVSFHPNSPPGSVFRTVDDYAVLFEHLDSAGIGWTPDVGHMAAVGMDPLSVIKEYRSLVNHVHFKDVDASGAWARTGEGTVDFPGVISHLRDTNFSGWIVMEDESPAAEADPDTVVAAAGDYMTAVLEPLAAGAQERI